MESEQRFLALVQAFGASPSIDWDIESSSRFIALDQAFDVGQSTGWYIETEQIPGLRPGI